MAAGVPIELTGEWVAAAAGGDLVAGPAERAFSGVSIDTRTIARGELYVGIRGERFDGADFAPAAVEAGAAGVMVPRGRGRGLAPAVTVIEVDEAVAALQALAHRVRRESGTTVVAITGSAGKTTTKEITAEFLSARYQVIRNRGNFNNHIGLPLSLIDLRRRPDVAVVELGMNHAGEISTLVRIAEPDIRVWTNVGDAHIGFFESADAIADAKAEILERATAATRLVMNADDTRIAARAASFRGRLITFGIESRADVRAASVEDRGVGGLRARVTTPRGAFDLDTPLPGRGNLANVLAATAVAVDLDVPVEEIARRARTLKPAAHRGEVVALGRLTLVDDSYNASPAATRRALDLLAASPAARRVAVLGEMLELGEHAMGLHEEIGRAAAKTVDLLVAVGGPPAAALARAAVAAGLPSDRVRHVATSAEAAEAAAALVTAGDLVLVKGSRGVRTERVVERLKQDFA